MHKSLVEFENVLYKKKLDVIFKTEDIISQKIFVTEFGSDFAKSIQDLYNFATAVYSFLVSSIIATKTQEFYFSEKGIKFFEELITRNNKLREEEKKRVLELLSTTRSLLEKDETIDKEIEGHKDSGTSQTNSLITSLKELKVTTRILDYYILTLYAYMDIYSMALLQYVLSSIQAEQLYEIINKVKNITNPSNTVDAILNFLSFEKMEPIKIKDVGSAPNTKIQKFSHGKNYSLNTLRDELLKENGYNNYTNVIRQFTDIRNRIAHRQPLTTINELRNQFPKHSKAAIKDFDKLSMQVQESNIPDDFKRLVVSALNEEKDEITNFFMITKLTDVLYRYFALIDNLVKTFFDN